MLNIILFNNFFEKSSIFQGNGEKQFRSTFNDCLGKGVLSSKLTWFLFTTKIVQQFFQKKPYFTRKLWKPFLGPKSLLKRRVCLATKMNITFFKGKEVSNIFSSNNFFKKSNTFKEIGKKNLWGHDHFLGEAAILVLVNTMRVFYAVKLPLLSRQIILNLTVQFTRFFCAIPAR